MGFFKNLFNQSPGGDKPARASLPWVALNDLDQLDEINSVSFLKTQLIYKHSTSCGISSMVLNRFTMAYSHEEEKADIYFLDIHRSRPVSDEIAQRYEVRHESPQLLVIKNGVVVAHRSHGAIPALDISLFLKKNPGS